MELPKDMTMVNYEVITLKRDFNDMFKGIDMRCSGRRLDLSLKNVDQPHLILISLSHGKL
jgi:hypothetical protein